MGREVVGRLLSGKPIDDLGLPNDDDGRADLRGLVISAAVVRDSGLGGRWSNVKTVDGALELRKITLSGLNLGGATATGLRMHRCRIVDCAFDEAQLRDLRLWDSEVNDSSFRRADLRDAAIGTWHRRRRNEWRNVSFEGADLRGIASIGAVFHGCDFSDGRLDRVNFDQCDLRDCRFAGRLREVLFDGRSLPDRPDPAPLRNVDFSRTRLEEVEFRDCQVEGVTLPDDPGIFFVPRHREVARRALPMLAEDASVEARMLTGWLEQVVHGPGDPTGVGLFNRRDFVDIGGEPLAELAERLYKHHLDTMP